MSDEERLRPRGGSHRAGHGFDPSGSPRATTGSIGEPTRQPCGHETVRADGASIARDTRCHIVVENSGCDRWRARWNFCTLPILFGVMKATSHFIIRQRGNLEGKLLGTRREIGRIDTGMVFDQRLKLTHGDDAVVVRRVTIELDTPTRDGDREMHILTDLPASVRADVMATTYRKRWTIETAFGDLTR